MIGKQVLERTVKDALDHMLGTQIHSSLTSLTVLEQSLFALNLSSDESLVLVEFLNSGAFESFIKSIGLLCVADNSGLPSQEEALTSHLVRALPTKPHGAISDLSHSIVGLLAQIAPEAWQAATELGLIGSGWNSELVVQSLVSDQIANAQIQIDQKIAATAASLKEVDTFAERYKRAVRYSTSKLKPQSLNEGLSIPIDDLYVEPLVIPMDDKNLQACPRGTMLASSRRAVLLGNPGGGKSTLAGKLCYDICSDTLDSSDPEIPELAALIVLRDYAQSQKVEKCSIVEYLEAHSKSEYQIDAPSGAFKLLMLSGRILVVFDGLDELIETRDRTAVTSAVEHFVIEYPIASILVTSREVGYEQAPLDRARFGHYKLSAFTDDQMKTYAGKWFRYSCDPNVEEGKKLAAAFVEESAIVTDIRSNPLMLGLLCNLYRQDGFLPRNRPEVYQRCADLLFTKWDKGRGIHIKLPLEHRLRPAMSHLAYWIYSNDSLQTGVTENNLIVATSAYLGQWVEDEAEAHGIAREFIEFFSGRAWVFTDVGADKTQKLFQFTHRTFLEYFTADELVRLFPKAEDLHAHLIGKIKSRSWDVVCQLAYQITVQRTLSHNVLVDLLCDEAKIAPLNERLKILSFLSRTIDLLYPMPPARREAVRLCVETVFENVTTIEKESGELTTLALETLGGILGTTDEAIKINGSEISLSILSVLGRAEVGDKTKADALILADDLTVAWRMSTELTRGEDRAKFWESQSTALNAETLSLRVRLAGIDTRIAIMRWWLREIHVEALAEKFGGEVFFTIVRFPFGSWFRSPISNMIVDWMMRRESDVLEFWSEEDKQRHLWMLGESARVAGLLISMKPWQVQRDRIFAYYPLHLLHRLQVENKLQWPSNSNISEAVLICLAATSENDNVDQGSMENAVGTVSDLVSFYRSHSSGKHRHRAHEVVEERCQRQDIIQRLHAWIDGGARFTVMQTKTIPAPSSHST